MEFPAPPEILLILICYFWILALPRDYRNLKFLAIFAVVISAHHLASLLNIYVGLPGTEGDSNTFHLNAYYAATDGRYPDITVGTGFYEWILVGVYKLFGPVKLNGQSFSVFMSALSLIFILRIAWISKVSAKNAMLLLLFVGLIPSHLFFTSIIFREVCQLTGFVGGCALILEAVHKRNMAYMVPASLMFLFMGLFHHVLLGFAVILTGLGVIYVFFVLQRSRVRAAMLSLGTLALIGFAGVVMFVFIPATDGNDYVDMMLADNSLASFIERYRSAVNSANPRTSYYFQVEGDSFLSMLPGLALSYLHYLSGPWWSEMNQTIDYVPFLNSVGRILFLLALIPFLISFRLTSATTFLIVIFVMMTFLWSLGSTNYGQAFRHHALTDWIPIFVLFMLRGVSQKEYRG